MTDNRSIHELIMDLKKDFVEKKEPKEPEKKDKKESRHGDGKQIKRDTGKRDNMDEKLLRDIRDELRETNKQLTECVKQLKSLADLQLLATKEALLKTELLKR
jgi:formate dehydrogenase maturation protein FdhE